MTIPPRTPVPVRLGLTALAVGGSGVGTTGLATTGVLPDADDRELVLST